MEGGPVAARYVRWKCGFAVLHRGYWLVASLYLVADAHLSASQLLGIGVVQSVIASVFEVPAGIVADTLSRKWSLVIAHGLMGVAIVITGMVTAYPTLVATQMAWGLAWTFVSGADVAWVTDELGDEARIDRVLADAARWEAVGSAIGLLAFGVLAWVAGRPTAIVGSGAAILMVGAVVAATFPETWVAPLTGSRWPAFSALLRRGGRLARGDRDILLVLAATFLVSGAGEVFGRLQVDRLVALGLPARPDPIVWLTALGLLGLRATVLAVRVVASRLDGDHGVRRGYAAACVVGAAGTFVLAFAPDAAVGAVGVLLVGGLSLTVIRLVGTVWVNRRITTDVRATVHSFLAQAEYLGEVAIGSLLALLARATTVTASLAGAGALLGLASALVLRHRPCGVQNEPARSS